MIRILIIVVVAIALLIGGVFGVATFAPNLLPNMVLELLGIEPPKEKTITQPVRPGPLETILIDLEPMEIPLFRDNKVDRKLFMLSVFFKRPTVSLIQHHSYYIYHSTSIAPFVIIPSKNFYLRSINYHS